MSAIFALPVSPRLGFSLRILFALLLGGFLASCASTPNSSGAEELKVQVEWRAFLGRGSHRLLQQQVPVANQDNIYVCDSNRLVALRLEDGKRLWRKKLPARLSSCLASYGDKLYVGDEDAMVHAVNAEDGEIIWSSELEMNGVSPPAANENLVLVQAINESLYALNANDGSILWSYSGYSPPLSLFGAFRPQLLGNAALAGFADGSIVFFDLRSGAPVSFRQIAVPQGDSDIERLIDIDGRVAYDRDALYVSSYSGSTIALDISSATEVWRRGISSSLPLLLDEDKLILVGDDNRIHALDKDTGENIWLNSEYALQDLTAPAFWNGYLFVGDERGYVYVLSAKDGTTLAKKRLNIQGINNFILSADEGVLIIDKEGYAHFLSLS